MHLFTQLRGYKQLQWTSSPRTVLVVKKPNNKLSTQAFLETLKWLKFRNLNIVVEEVVMKELGEKEQDVLYTVNGDLF